MKLLKSFLENTNEKEIEKLNDHLNIYKLGCMINNNQKQYIEKIHTTKFKNIENCIAIKLYPLDRYIIIDKKSFKECIKNIKEDYNE